MRIVAGKYRGLRLQVPAGRDIRPTSDKVRGAVFNALEARGAVVDAQVLDCFCGTGALGLEALSRGAEFCAFWDKDQRSLDLAKANAESLEVMDRCAFIKRDAARPSDAPQDQKYSLVFLDPPYRKNLTAPVLKALSEHGWLADDAICVLEIEKEYDLDMSAAFTLQLEKIYGDTKILFTSYTNKS